MFRDRTFDSAESLGYNEMPDVKQVMAWAEHALERARHVRARAERVSARVHEVIDYSDALRRHGDIPPAVSDHELD